MGSETHPGKHLGQSAFPGADARSAAQRRPQSDAVCQACAAKTRCRTRSAVRSAVKWHQRWSFGSGRKAGRQRVRVYPDGSMHASPGERAACPPLCCKVARSDQDRWVAATQRRWPLGRQARLCPLWRRPGWRPLYRCLRRSSSSQPPWSLDFVNCRPARLNACISRVHGRLCTWQPCASDSGSSGRLS